MFFMPAKSFTATGILVPISAVPALPGAMYNFFSKGLCANFHANACSLPPEPISKIFMI